MRTRNARRHALSPDPLALEARRLMTASPAHVKVQAVSSGGAFGLVIQGTNRADTFTISDNGTAAAGNITVALADGTSYVSKKAISYVQIVGGRGADRVTYLLTGDLVADRAVIAQLGAGNDQLTANLIGAVQTTGRFDFQGYGEAGNDALTISQPGAITAGTNFQYLDGGTGNDNLTYRGSGAVGAAAVFGPGLVGGGGNDTITLGYQGQVLGTLFYNMTADGGAGNDAIDADVVVAASSTGRVGGSGTTGSIVQGGAGDDAVRFRLVVDTSDTDTTMAAVTASALGNAGKDGIRRSLLVTGSSSNENDAILSA